MEKPARQFPIRGTRVVRRVPEILRLCRNKKILHLGCADAPFTLYRGEALLHKQLLTVTEKDLLWGLDESTEGVEILRDMGFDHIHQVDIEGMGPDLRKEEFDIILAGEIIEHVANPGMFLKAVISLMGEKTEFILTTVNATSFKQFLHAMMRREKVHQDHNYYFSYRTIKQLLEKFNLSCREVYYYQEIEGRGLAKFLDRCFSMVTWVSPVLSDGIIVRAVVRKE
jgi:predicted TPR repeat methyltransferase